MLLAWLVRFFAFFALFLAFFYLLSFLNFGFVCLCPLYPFRGLWGVQLAGSPTPGRR